MTDDSHDLYVLVEPDPDADDGRWIASLYAPADGEDARVAWDTADTRSGACDALRASTPEARGAHVRPDRSAAA